HVADNTPWDHFERKMVKAQGSTLENGADNFYVLHNDPRAMAETTSQALLGMTINCSRCHFFFSSRRRHTRSKRDWSSDVCSSDLQRRVRGQRRAQTDQGRDDEPAADKNCERCEEKNVVAVRQPHLLGARHSAVDYQSRDRKSVV